MNQTQNNKAIEKLSSGLRINRAGDDAAGLSISEKMRSQVRGLAQASRNIQDGISLVQTAEGGLNEVHSLLQRGKELAVQAANGTLSYSDQEALQDEIDQIREEIDGISERTHFNGIPLLSRGSSSSDSGSSKSVEQQILEALPGMLQNSEQLIEQYFGLTGDHAGITVFLDDNHDGSGGTLAYVSSMIYGNEGKNIELHIDTADFTSYVAPNGNSDPFNYLDRTIAHEMVHAVFYRALNMTQSGSTQAVPTWFNEGSAEFIKGGGDRLFAEIQNRVNGGMTLDNAAQAVMNSLANDGQAWGGDSVDYAAAYAAIRYIDENVSAHSGGAITDYKGFLTQLYNGGARDTSVDDVLATTTWGSLSGFISDFKANGLTLVKSIYDDFRLSGDVGAPVPGKTQDNVVLDDLESIDDFLSPLDGWNISFPAEMSQLQTALSAGIVIQAGANAGQSLNIGLSTVNVAALKLEDIDITTKPDEAITSFDQAIESVSRVRGRFGAIQNRLEHALAVTGINLNNTTEAESRIRDMDMAKAMMEQTRSGILAQAAQAMLAQANQQPQSILQLLRA